MLTKWLNLTFWDSDEGIRLEIYMWSLWLGDFMSSLGGNRRLPWAYQHLEIRGLSLLKQNEKKKASFSRYLLESKWRKCFRVRLCPMLILKSDREQKLVFLLMACKHQFSSVTQSCLTLWDPMDCSMPGLPVHHQLPEFTQIHVHLVSDTIQPSHPVVPFSSCPQSLPASESFPMSQLFAWGGQSTGVSASASFLPKNTQDWSPLELTGWMSLQSKGLSTVFSNTTDQKHQFFGAQLSLQSNSHIHTWLLEKP